MSDQSHEHVTHLLQAAAAGEREAGAKLLPLVYDHLRSLARARMRALPPGNTLQPTALVNEAYARLVGRSSAGDPGWESRGRFFAAAATAMRDILVEQARRKAAIKHGGGLKRGEADPESLPTPGDVTPAFESPAEDMLALDAAIRRLEEVDSRKASVVMLRYFAGLEAAEIALSLGISVPTVDRDWAFAKAWLKNELSNSLESDGQRPGA